jgi:hypothetical protein
MADLEAESAALFNPPLPEACFVTMGVGAPSKSSAADLQRVDVDLPSAFARAAKTAGVGHLSLLTSVGADKNASSWFGGTGAGGGLYLKAKGDVEAACAGLHFARGVSAIRPSTLLGNTNTPGIMDAISGIVDRLVPARFQSVHINDVAKAMIGAAVHAQPVDGAVSGAADVFQGKRLFDMAATEKWGSSAKK